MFSTTCFAETLTSAQVQAVASSISSIAGVDNLNMTNNVARHGLDPRLQVAINIVSAFVPAPQPLLQILQSIPTQCSAGIVYYDSTCTHALVSAALTELKSI